MTMWNGETIYMATPGKWMKPGRHAAIYTDEPFEQATNPTYTDNHAEPSGNGDFADTGSGANIVQTGIGVLIELCVQPHQAKVSSGGGGGGNESGWGENDNEKDKLKPRRRRR